ncbi:MAG: cellulase family glycosylhydrolase [Anaerolineae bacterium]|nr:cellulase family glycosylhydrolase [Anaerolineae bacterium]
MFTTMVVVITTTLAPISAVTHTGPDIDPEPKPETCVGQDAGFKGINLPPYDPIVGVDAGIIRAGDEKALEALKDADVQWVRLEFIQKGGSIDLKVYDYMVDHLCNSRINVLGLLSASSLNRSDYNSPAGAASYRAEFAALAKDLAQHFRGRISAWEVWNEPNDRENAYLSAEHFAALVRKTSSDIRIADASAQVIMGGLASGWRDSFVYFQLVMAALGDVTLAPTPFDHIAIHPYPNGVYGDNDPRNPEDYLFISDGNPNDNTQLDRFVRVLDENGRKDAQIWVTEFGFNAAKGVANRPTCQEAVLVTEDEQAKFMRSGFNVLLGEAERKAVPKVFWFQFMDRGGLSPCEGQETAAFLFGLYRSDKITTKPVQCAFRTYQRGGMCARVYLPLAINR